jgi:SAM-dependent methyltransferase
VISLNVSEADVIRQISPNDRMFQGSADHYFGVGRSVLGVIGHSLAAAHKPVADVKRILDLPCGHGRILRYLQAAFPKAGITACDINRDGVDFCASTFGAAPVYSSPDPARIPLGHDAFDLILVVSLFTHLDADRWPGFLELFRSRLRPGGVLVFTTHGGYAYHHPVKGHEDCWETALRPGYDRTGFGYVELPEQEIPGRYGISLSAPSWVFGRLATVSQLRVVHFAEHGQDVFACVRDTSWPQSLPPLPE